MRCGNAEHQHSTYLALDGTMVDEPVPMRCWGETNDGRPCGRPAHLDKPTGRYRHDDPAAPPCDMADRRRTACRGAEEQA